LKAKQEELLYFSSVMSFFRELTNQGDGTFTEFWNPGQSVNITLKGRQASFDEFTLYSMYLVPIDIGFGWGAPITIIKNASSNNNDSAHLQKIGWDGLFLPEYQFPWKVPEIRKASNNLYRLHLFYNTSASSSDISTGVVINTDIQEPASINDIGWQGYTARGLAEIVIFGTILLGCAMFSLFFTSRDLFRPHQRTVTKMHPIQRQQKRYEMTPMKTQSFRYEQVSADSLNHSLTTTTERI
jgi:hypothetical protein